MKALPWRVIYHQHLYGSSVKETAQYLFTSTGSVSKIRKLYRGRGEVNWKRRWRRKRILSLKYLKPGLYAVECKAKIRFCTFVIKYSNRAQWIFFKFYNDGLGNCSISFATVHDLLGCILLTTASVLYISHRFVIRQHRGSEWFQLSELKNKGSLQSECKCYWKENMKKPV